MQKLKKSSFTYIFSVYAIIFLQTEYLPHTIQGVLFPPPAKGGTLLHCSLPVKSLPEWKKQRSGLMIAFAL